VPIESIVHVISDSGPHPYFRTLIEGDRRDRSRLLVGCVGPPGPLQDDMRALGVETFALGARSRAGYPAATLRFARLLRARQAQVVQTHLVDGSLVGLAAARLARTPSVFTAHHSHELPFQGRRLRWADRAFGRLCDVALAPSAQVAATLTAEAGMSADKIRVVHHGFDLARLDPERISGDAVRAELGLSPDDVVLGAIGRLFWLKDQEALLRALAEVPAVRLVVVGDGDRAPLEALARELGIADRVIFTGPRSDVPEVLAALDAFVHPALAESFGMVIIEAMAMARPVLSTPVGIAPEVIESGATSILAAATGAAALADGLRELLALRPLWPEMGVAARERVSGFTAARMADDYEALYDDLMDSTSK
jgi:glycosyltransferase involved in cell wall biosynthesis